MYQIKIKRFSENRKMMPNRFDCVAVDTKIWQKIIKKNIAS